MELAVRPIESDDKRAFRAAFEQLSSESRYLRFPTSMNELSAKELR